MDLTVTTSLKGKRGLVVGIANKASIAAGCARAFVDAGADLAATYQRRGLAQRTRGRRHGRHQASPKRQKPERTNILA
jgi:enoyl-[acyl-carrier-protein] reductase (NADH)